MTRPLAFAWLVLAMALLPTAPAAGQDARAKAQFLFKQAFELFQAGEFEAAALGFKEGLALDPASGLGHFYLAETYARQNKLDLALPHYEQTVALAPDSKEALIVRSRLPQMKGKAEEQAALRKWVGKWRDKKRGSVMEIKSSGNELIMVFVRPSSWNHEYRPGELFAKGTLKGTAWEGEVADDYKNPSVQRCFGDRLLNPMKANISVDGNTIIMKAGNFLWDFDVNACRAPGYRTSEENDREERDRELYTRTYARILE